MTNEASGRGLPRHARWLWGLLRYRCSCSWVSVRRDDLALLLYAFDHPDATALGSRPFRRLRDAGKSAPASISSGDGA